MTGRVRTTIERIAAAPGQRLLVVSDIHGHFDYLVQLLRRLEYDNDDVLIVVGDLVDKGPESLRVVQYLMDLCRRHPVYVSMGNVDLARLSMLQEDSPESGEEFAGFVQWSERYWGSSLFQEMLEETGVKPSQLNGQNAAEYRRRLREQFHEELDFLGSRPTILTAGRYLFVHGGIPTEDLEALEGTDAVPYLKNDAFLDRSCGFEKYTVVTGHWPACLYRRDREDVSPLFDREKNILCIDGGCGLKSAGQLNGIIIPDCRSEMKELQWTSYDGFPLATALESQEERSADVHITYFDCKVELLEENGNMGRIRQLSSGKTMEVPLSWLKTWNSGELCCSDCCDRYLPVSFGEQLSVIYEAQKRHYVKKRGEIGWYEGEMRPVQDRLQLIAGAPWDRCWRRERELAVYDLLERLNISFQRVDHCEANTMEACRVIDDALDAVICKNLFLCNQQRTMFYLLMMPEGKKFKTKDLSKQINSARLSFAEAVYMERFLHISPGSVSVMGLMNDRENRVQLLIDREILTGAFFGCHPCMNTSSIRLRFTDLLEKFLPAVHHEPYFVELPSAL